MNGAKVKTSSPSARTTSGMSQPRSTGPTGTVQKIGNVQKTPKNPNKGNLGMSQNQRMTASPQTRGTDMRGGQPRATQNTMAGKSGGKRD